MQLGYVISISEPPVIHNTAFFPKQLVDHGSNEEFVCTASGLPTPDVKWITKDDIIEGPSLFFTSVNQEHEGDYTCIAENTAGVVNKTMTIIVSRKSLFCRSEYLRFEF